MNLLRDSRNTQTMKTCAIGVFVGISLLVSQAGIAATQYNSAVYAQLNYSQRSLYERCVHANEQERGRGCRLLAREHRRDLELLKLLAAELEEAGRYAEAIAVYDEGLKVRENSGALKRRRALAVSNLEETQNVAAPTKDADDSVAATLDTIKCLHLALSDALPACERALQADPENDRVPRASG